MTFYKNRLNFIRTDQDTTKSLAKNSNRNKETARLTLFGFLCIVIIAQTVSGQELTEFRTRLLSASARHLDMLLDSNGKTVSIKGKSADCLTAFAFYRMYEITGNQKYRTAALGLTDKIVNEMKATKFGVLYIKEKEKKTGEMIPGGGPPPFAWFTSIIAYIFHKEGDRNDGLRYIATIVDKYPWNEKGWWSSSIDITTGKSKVPLTKPSIINKNATMAMAAGMISDYVKGIEPALSARLKNKADKCIYDQIIPAQEPDGFWHYSLSGNDPKGKDILGYFMLTTVALIQVQQFTDSYRDPVFQASLDKAYAFALNCIAPMTDPNKGNPCPNRATPETPSHYTVDNDTKRGFSLGCILFGGKTFREGIKITDHAIKYFPYGESGQDGARAVHSSAIILSLLQSK